MPAFTPAITSLNGLEVVRLNRSISIFLVISKVTAVLVVEIRSSDRWQGDCGGVLMRPIMTRVGMTLTRIAVDRCVRFLGKCRFNIRSSSLGNEFILLGEMHENGRMKAIDLSQIFVSIGAVIPDRGVDAVVADGGHEDHKRAEAIAEQGNLTVAFRETAYCVDSVLDVLYAGISVISLIEEGRGPSRLGR